MTKQDSILTVGALYDAFKNGTPEASDKYLNQTITVKGIVGYAGPDEYKLPSIELVEKMGERSHVLCVLPFMDYPKLMKVAKGEECSIKGEVHVFHNNTMVVMKKCKIVK